MEEAKRPLKGKADSKPASPATSQAQEGSAKPAAKQSLPRPPVSQQAVTVPKASVPTPVVSGSLRTSQATGDEASRVTKVAAQAPDKPATSRTLSPKTGPSATTAKPAQPVQVDISVAQGETPKNIKAPVKKPRFLKGEKKEDGAARPKKNKATQENKGKEQSKPKGRVYRSIHAHSWTSLLVSAVTILLVVVGLWWSKNRAPWRLVEVLKNFEIPAEHVMYADCSYLQELVQGRVSPALVYELKKNKVHLSTSLLLSMEEAGKKWQIYDDENDSFIFITKEKPAAKLPERLAVSLFEIAGFRLHGSPAPAIVVDAKSPRVIPIICQNYGKMSRLEKIAAVIVLGEMRDVQGMPVVIDALSSEEPLLAAFASRALAKFGEAAVQPVVAKFDAANSRQRSYLLDGIARTKQQTALTAIGNLAKSNDAAIRKTAVAKLFFFGEYKAAIDILLDILADSQPSVGDEAVQTLYRLYKNSSLNKYGEHILARIKQRLATNPERAVLCRLYRVMGMMGNLTPTSIAGYPDLIKNFKDWMYKSLHSEFSEEVAAAAYGLGLFEDDEASDLLLLRLDHKSPEVSQDIAFALNNINNAEIAQKILDSTLAQSNHQHTLLALARILNHYHLHIAKLGLKDKAWQMLQEAQKHAKDDAATALAETIAAYGDQGEKK